MNTPLPALPDFIARALPFDRRMLALEDAPNAGLLLHCIDHGARTARPVLMLHGNPTWSFLWRKVIARLDGFRCLAPDLLGLGLSSKLRRLSEHTVRRHGEAIAELIRRMALEDIVLVVQDWGGPIGLAAAARVPERIAGVVIANTAVILPKQPRGTAFHRFARMPVVSDLVFRLFGFPLRQLHRAQGDPGSIRGDVARAYRWPLRHLHDRVAPLAMARMVPDGPDHPSLGEMRRGQAWIEAFPGPVALVWGHRDPVLGRALKRHAQALEGALLTDTPAGHFLQEEVPDELAAAVRTVAERSA